MTDTTKQENFLPSQLPLNLFTKRGNKTTQLVNNTSDDAMLDGKRKWFTVKLEEPVFVQDLSIDVSGYDDFNRLEIGVKLSDQVRSSGFLKLENDNYKGRINCLTDEISFRPEQKYLSNPKIKSIRLTGYTPDQLDLLQSDLGELDRLKDNIQKKYDTFEAKKIAADEQLKNTQEKIKSLEVHKASLETETGKLLAQNESLSNEIINIKNVKSKIDVELQDVQSKLESRQDEQRNLISEIDSNQIELKSVKDELRIFPSDIAGFVKEGKRNIQSYLVMSLPFVTVILYITYQLFFSTIEIIKIYDGSKDGIWTVFLARLPFVIVAVTILQVCGFAVSRFVFEIVNINRQRLNLSKLSIIAKDVSTFATSGLKLTADEQFEYETHLKMQLLREHMRQYISEDFSYKAGSIDRLLPEWSTKKAPKNKQEQNPEIVPDAHEGEKIKNNNGE